MPKTSNNNNKNNPSQPPSNQDPEKQPQILSDQDASLSITPISVSGRTHYACLRCRALKIKCSSEKPCCQNCKTASKQCEYSFKDRKIIVLQSQLNKLTNRIKQLESLLLSKDSTKLTNITSSISDSLNNPTFNDKQSQIKELDNAINSSFGDDFSSINENNHSNTLSNTDFNMDIDSNTTNNHNIQTKSRFNFTPDSNVENWHIKDSTLSSSHPSTVIKLPNKRKSLKLIQITMDHFQDSHYLFDQKVFLNKINYVYNNLKCENSQFLAKFFISLAIGELLDYSSVSNHFSPKDFQIKYGCFQPGLKYYKISIDLFQMNLEEPKLSEVQTILLMGYYNQSLNRITNSYMLFGIATRWSLSLNLHLNTKNNNLLESSKRKRIWWTVFVLDSFATSRVKLPMHVNFNQTNIDLLDESDHIYWSGSKVLAAQVLLLKFTDKIINSIYYVGEKSEYIMDDNNLLNKSFLESIINNVIHMIKMLEYHFENYLKQDFEIMLNEFKSNTLSSSSKSLLHVFMKYHQLVITTCRPVILIIFKKLIVNVSEFLKSDLLTILNKCINSSFENLYIILKLINIKLLNSFDYWHTHFCFNSTLILLITFPDGNNLNWYDSISKMESTISDVNQSNHCKFLRMSFDLLKSMAYLGNQVAKDAVFKLNLIVNLFLESKVYPNNMDYFRDLLAVLNDCTKFDLWDTSIKGNNINSQDPVKTSGLREEEEEDDDDDYSEEEIIINLKTASNTISLSSGANSSPTTSMDLFENIIAHTYKPDSDDKSKQRKLNLNLNQESKKLNKNISSYLHQFNNNSDTATFDDTLADSNSITSSGSGLLESIDFDDLEKDDILRDSNPNKVFPILFDNSELLPNYKMSRPETISADPPSPRRLYLQTNSRPQENQPAQVPSSVSSNNNNDKNTIVNDNNGQLWDYIQYLDSNHFMQMYNMSQIPNRDINNNLTNNQNKEFTNVNVPINHQFVPLTNQSSNQSLRYPPPHPMYFQNQPNQIQPNSYMQPQDTPSPIPGYQMSNISPSSRPPFSSVSSSNHQPSSIPYAFAPQNPLSNSQLSSTERNSNPYYISESNNQMNHVNQMNQNIPPGDNTESVSNWRNVNRNMNSGMHMNMNINMNANLPNPSFYNNYGAGNPNNPNVAQNSNSQNVMGDQLRTSGMPDNTTNAERSQFKQ